MARSLPGRARLRRAARRREADGRAALGPRVLGRRVLGPRVLGPRVLGRRALALAALTLALTGCAGNVPPVNYATTGPDGAQEPASPTQPPGPAEPGSADPEPDAPAETSAPPADADTYELCPEGLADAWLELGGAEAAGVADAVSLADFTIRAVGVGTPPVGSIEVVCSTALEHPNGERTTTLSVLAGPGGIAEIVAAIGVDRGLREEASPQAGAALALVSDDGATRYVLFRPGAPMLAEAGIEPAATSYLLEGTVSTR